MISIFSPSSPHINTDNSQQREQVNNRKNKLVMVDQRITDMEPRAGGKEGNRPVALIYRTLAGLAVGGPLVLVLGFPLLGFLTALVIVISPLLLLFSPILIPAAMVLFRTVAGYGAAAAIREVINRIKHQLGMSGQEPTGVEPRIRDQSTGDKPPGTAGMEPRDRQQATGGSGRPALYGTLAGVALGGPLLVLMGLTLLGSGTVLVISSPLLLLFSPVLVPAALGLFAVMAGLGAAAAMAVVGLHALALGYRSASGARRRTMVITRQDDGGGDSTGGVDDVEHHVEIEDGDEIENVEMATGSGQRVREQVSKLEDELKTGPGTATA